MEINQLNMSERGLFLRLMIQLPNKKKLKLNVEIDSSVLLTRDYLTCSVNFEKWEPNFENIEIIKRDVLLRRSKRHPYAVRKWS